MQATLFRRSIVVVLLLAGGPGCLGPLVDDEIDPTRIFGDPKINPQDAPEVEDDPTMAAKVALFPSSVAYLNGFADGAAIKYWNIGGPVPSFIAPIYEIVDQDGHPIGRRIIDAIPGDPGYSPWWRLIKVKTTAKYSGERIWSRAAIDEGLKLGILATPEPQMDVLDCPVVRGSARIAVGPGEPKEPTWGWYRNQRVYWFDFPSSTIQLNPFVREMPAYPVYVFQRINQAEPLYELVAKRDINGDGDMDDSNNVFANGLGGERYSPLWYPAFVRTVADYVSIDTTSTSTAVGLTAESQMVDAMEKIISPLIVPNGIAKARDILINCPVQKTEGEL